MNIKKWTALLVIATGPAGLLASNDTDHKIEEAAKDSYNYRTVLNDKVDVRAQDGVVTIRGEAASDAEKILVTKLAGSIRGVASVDNRMTVQD